MRGQVGQVIELAFEHALDAVDSAEDAVENGVELIGSHDARETCVDDGGWSARLGDKAVSHDAS